MFKKYLYGIPFFALAFAILSISVLRSASARYAFATPPPGPVLGNKAIAEIDYQLPYPGRILPDSPFWVVKAVRDRVWYSLTRNPSKKAELSLLFSDKRLAMSKMLFEKQKPELAFSTLTKGEKYLETAVSMEEEARKRGSDTTDFLTKLTMGSLKHRQVINEILTVAPEDAKPGIIKMQDYSTNAYQKGRSALNFKGISSPKNPFDRE